MENACLEVSFLGCLGEGERCCKKKKGGGGKPPDLCLPHLSGKPSMRVDCADQDLMDLVVRNIGDDLLQRLRKLD